MQPVIFNILQSNTKGGMENIFIDYAKILNSANFKIICLTSTDFPENQILDLEKIQRINLNIKGHFDLLAAFKLFFLVKKYQPNLIIAHNGRSFATLNILKKLLALKTKILAVSHGGNVKRLLGFDYAIGVASHITQNIKDRNFKGEIKTIYNGLKITPVKTGLKQNKIFTFGTLSRLSLEKNIALTLKAFAKFNQKINRNSKLIIGGEGPEKENLIKLTRDLDVADKVDFIGWISDKEKFFNQIDIFVQSAFKEPFGLTIIESFNYQCPVLAADSGGPKEIIKNNYSGFLFKTNSEKSLFLKMKQIYENKGDFPKIRKQALKELKNKFSYEIMAGSLIKFINSALRIKPKIK